MQDKYFIRTFASQFKTTLRTHGRGAQQTTKSMKTNVNNNFNQKMRNVMMMAWQFVKQNGFTMSEALKTAWRNFKLHKEMNERIVKFVFQKVDNTIRVAYGTLKSSIVPATGDGRKPNPTIQVYYDTEKNDWRCFKKAGLIEVSI